MNSQTREFLSKLHDLLDEYNTSFEIEGDKHTGDFSIILGVEGVDYWPTVNPQETYPVCEWLQMGNKVCKESVGGLIQ